MDMDGIVRAQGRNPAEIVERDRTQRMGGDAEPRVRQVANRGSAVFEQALIGVALVDEAALAMDRGRLAEIAEAIEHRQKREAEPGFLSRGGDRLPHGGDIRVRAAVLVVVEIVEFGERGEAAFQHLDEGLGGDGLHVVRIEPVEEAVHHLAPGPEGILRRAAAFREAGHTALEGVAVQVRHAGQGDACEATPLPGRRHVGLDGRDEAAFDRQLHVPGEALR